MSEILEIKAWYKDKLLPKIYRKRDGEWYDLFCAEDIFIPQFCERLVSLGVVIQLPEGYEASLQSRSSTFKHYGVIQGDAVGVMDNAYRGKNDIWKFPAVCINPHDECLGTKGSWIRKGDRICQFRLVKQQPKAVIREIQTVEDESRGGFGSSGKR
jgi:dUTP pyrophosphatase